MVPPIAGLHFIKLIVYGTFTRASDAKIGR